MAAFRVLLVKPIFDNVLSPDAYTHDVLVFPHVPLLGRPLNLHFLVPSPLHNAWTVVAYALVVSALVKSVCDYVGTYLVNYAGFGMITDLRNDLYNAVLRRSVGFFQKHTTGTLLSTLINDIERVQTAMSSVLGEFLQQIFTLIFYDRRGDFLWWEAGLGAAAVRPRGHLFGAAYRKESAPDYAQGPGQTGGDTKYSPRDDYGESNREGLRDGVVGDEPFSARGTAIIQRQPAVGERTGH